MALPSSGQLSIDDIVGEFGGSAPHGLEEYYGAAAGIPASGEISIQDFYGASSVYVSTITEGSTSTTQTIVKNTFSVELYGYAQNTEEAVPTGFGSSWPASTIGSRSPTTYNGVTIEAALRYESNFLSPPVQTFIFILQGNRAQNFFTSITPQGTTALTSASASYSYDSTGNYTKWSWSSLSDPPAPLGSSFISQWNGSGTSTITIV
jgi:hypothetical protein